MNGAGIDRFYRPLVSSVSFYAELILLLAVPTKKNVDKFPET